MNKSERDSLANIVSSMIYSFDSSKPVISEGMRILDAFPCIKQDLENYRYAVATLNVTGVIISSLWHEWDPSLLRKEVKQLSSDTYDSVDGIFDAYLENYEGDDFLTHLYDIEKRLADADDFNARSIVSQLVDSDYWRTAVAEVYDAETAEYNYLTLSK